MIKEHEEYLLTFLFENKELNLSTKVDQVDNKTLRWANQIAERLKLKFNGFLEYNKSLPVYYKNIAFFTDPITKSTLAIQVNDYVKTLKKVEEKLKNMRYKFIYSN